MTADRKSKIAIVGAGPAGSGLAIYLAQAGFKTVLIEREKFPREKLCGEFISPECIAHFQQLGVLEEMLAAGGEQISETRFFETGGKSITVPSDWFGGGNFALGLSRAEMDHQLLMRAKAVGVEVREETSVTAIEKEHDGSVGKLVARTNDGTLTEIAADIYVDATGRAGILSKLADKNDADHRTVKNKPGFVGFKAHLANTDLEQSCCEIYSFPGGYAGLSNVENSLANLCFLVKSEIVRSTGDANAIVKKVVCRNRRAQQTLKNFSAAENWLAVSITGFGTKKPAPLRNLFTVGDAASFIDPFTGSGMVMALESARVLADVTIANAAAPEMIASEYLRAYRQTFSRRLRVCSVLRRTAFMPRLATVVVSALSLSSNARRLLARATRR